MESVVEIKASNGLSSARIAPEAGFNCFDFQVAVDGEMISLLDAEPEFPSPESRPSGHGTPLLFPFPNRIRGGRFSWKGKSFQLPAERVAWDRTGNAIHGFCLDRPWRVVDRQSDSVTGEFQLSRDASDRLELWPADFIVRATYSIQPTRLNLEFEIENPDRVDLPWGFGTHSYFRLPLGSSSSPDDCLIEARLKEQWELTDCLPTGEMSPLPESLDFEDGFRYGSTSLDDVFSLHAFSSPEDRRTIILDEKAGVQLEQRFSKEFEHLVVFTPPGRDAICLEPYTCMTDAMNHPDYEGIHVLPAGEKTRLFVVLEVSPVIA